MHVYFVLNALPAIVAPGLEEDDLDGDLSATPPVNGLVDIPVAATADQLAEVGANQREDLGNVIGTYFGDAEDQRRSYWRRG